MLSHSSLVLLGSLLWTLEDLDTLAGSSTRSRASACEWVYRMLNLSTAETSSIADTEPHLSACGKGTCDPCHLRTVNSPHTSSIPNACHLEGTFCCVQGDGRNFTFAQPGYVASTGFTVNATLDGSVSPGQIQLYCAPGAAQAQNKSAPLPGVASALGATSESIRKQPIILRKLPGCMGGTVRLLACASDVLSPTALYSLCHPGRFATVV